MPVFSPAFRFTQEYASISSASMRRYANSPLPGLHAMYTSATSSPATSRKACSSSSVVWLSTSSPAARLLSTSLEYLWLLSWIYTASISSAVSTFSATI